MVMKNLTIYLLCISVTLLFNCSSQNKPNSNAQKITLPKEPEVVAQDLEVPWGMDFLPDGRLVFNERPGRISVADLKTKEVKLLLTRDISAKAEGGLLGLAVDPEFEKNHYIFIYETMGSGNRIVRLIFENETLTENKILLDSIPKKFFHDGGILRFGPDGFLYVGTGDARDPNSAQDLTSNAGKILRMDRDGNIPADNPFKNYIWSYGHRNVQGLCWTSDGTMFATEHGPSGELNGWCCHDEVNVIVKGNNYGWPKVIGDDIATGTILPFAHSGEDTWAPGGIIYVDDFNEQNKEVGSIIFACLRGERLVQFDINKNQTITSPINKDEKQLFPQIYGRLRNIILAPDGSIVFSTSNEDGRGNAEKNDDRIMIMYQ